MPKFTKKEQSRRSSSSTLPPNQLIFDKKIINDAQQARIRLRRKANLVLHCVFTALLLCGCAVLLKTVFYDGIICDASALTTNLSFKFDTLTDITLSTARGHLYDAALNGAHNISSAFINNITNIGATIISTYETVTSNLTASIEIKSLCSTILENIHMSALAIIQTIPSITMHLQTLWNALLHIIDSVQKNLA